MGNDHRKSPEDAPDHEPMMNNDPMDLPQTTKEKISIAPDPQKVRAAGREDHPITDENDRAPIK